MADAYTTLRYRGACAAEGRPAGQIEMTLFADGRVRVAHDQPAAVYKGTLAAWVWPELGGHLQAAGFPTLPRPPAAAGRGALLSIVTAAGALQMMWTWPAHRSDPRLDRAMRILEAIAHEVSAGALAFYPRVERSVLA